MKDQKSILQFLEPFLIKRMRFRLNIGIIILIGFFGFNCSDNPQEEPVEEYGKVVIYFEHSCENSPVYFDTLVYTNVAGNQYLINEIQYFISDVTLYKDDGTVKMIDDWKDIHYVDSDIPETFNWEVYDKIEPGYYDSIAFTFGFNESKNISFMFVNSPEMEMFWPEYLGGGFHYLKLNGKWLPEGQIQTLPFNFHMGIGQIYYQESDSIVGFVHNHFRVSLPGSEFSISKGGTEYFVFVMNVEKWFEQPHVYNHDEFGGDIMQKQEAMQIAKENGWNVFTFARVLPD